MSRRLIGLSSRQVCLLALCVAGVGGGSPALATQARVVERVPLPSSTGTELRRGLRYYSDSGAYFLVLNPDGNLVVAKADGTYIWGLDRTPGVDFRSIQRVVWQEDGNLAAYGANGKYIWSALHRNPDCNARLNFTDDGVLQIVAGNRVLWQNGVEAPAGGSLVPSAGAASQPTTSAPARPATASASSGVALVVPQSARPVKASGGPGAAGRGGLLAFVSRDGSAGLGSRSVFTLTNVANGQTLSVPVPGQKAKTRVQVGVAPGTYRVTPPPPSIGKYTSFTVQRVSATQVTVPAGGGSASAGATVDFSLAATRAPVAMIVTGMTESSVSLKWAALPDANVASYTLVRTDGRNAAGSPGAGVRVPLARPTATTATAGGLTTGREYTFTLFSTARTGEALPVRTFTATTAPAQGTAASYALAPNAIVVTNFDSLRIRAAGEQRVQVTLSPGGIQRASSSPAPGGDHEAVQGASCVVGTPFLASTEVAGDRAFFGTIDECLQGNDAVVNANVPMSAVFDHFKFKSGTARTCFDATANRTLPADAPLCAPPQPAPSAAAVGVGGGVRGREPAPSVPVRTFTYKVSFDWTGEGAFDMIVQGPGTGGPKVEVKAAGAAGSCTPSQKFVGTEFDFKSDGLYTITPVLRPGCRATGVGRYSISRNGQAAISSGRYRMESLTPFRIRIEKRQWFINDATAPALFGSLNRTPLLQPTAAKTPPALAATLDGWALNNSASSFRSPLATHGPSAFKPSGLAQVGALGAANAIALPLASLQGSSLVQCERGRKVNFTLQPGLEPFWQGGVDLETDEFTWDARIGVTASVNPSLEFAGETTCSLDLPKVTIPVLLKPVPIDFTIGPEVSVTANNKMTLQGPKLSLTIGVKSSGKATAEVEWCGWDSPCYEANIDQTTTPIATFTRGETTSTIEGSLKFAAGGRAELTTGKDFLVLKARAGVGMTVSPVVAKLEGKVGPSTCVNAALGYELNAELFAELFFVGWGARGAVELYKKEGDYDNAKFELGDCK